MKLRATLGLTALLLVGCASTPQTTSEPSQTRAAPTTEAPPTVASIDGPTPEPATDDSAVESALAEAFTPPTEAPAVDESADPEAQYLEAFKQELTTLPEGPFEQAGTDTDAVNLGYEACGSLSFMDHGDALLEYVFQPESTEETVANYNAALNVVPFTLCPPEN